MTTEQEQTADNRQRYEVICPVCRCEFLACASIFQTDFGMLEYGSGYCPGCGTKLNLTLDPENGRMIPAVFDEWLQKQKGKDGAAHEIKNDCNGVSAE